MMRLVNDWDQFEATGRSFGSVRGLLWLATGDNWYLKVLNLRKGYRKWVIMQMQVEQQC